MDKKLELDIQILNAMDSGDLELLEHLFQNTDSDVLEITPVEHWNWLHTVLLGFDANRPPVSTINYLIDKGVSVNTQDACGMTPLHYALRSKNIEAAIALLKAGANPNLPNIRGITPLCYINGYPERLDLLQLMLDKGGDVDFFTGQHQILEGIKKYRAQDPIFTPVIELMEKYSKQN